MKTILYQTISNKLGLINYDTRKRDRIVGLFSDTSIASTKLSNRNLALTLTQYPKADTRCNFDKDPDGGMIVNALYEYLLRRKLVTAADHKQYFTNNFSVTFFWKYIIIIIHMLISYFLGL